MLLKTAGGKYLCAALQHLQVQVDSGDPASGRQMPSEERAGYQACLRFCALSSCRFHLL